MINEAELVHRTAGPVSPDEATAASDLPGRHHFVARFRKQYAAVAALAYLLGLGLVALIGPHVIATDPNAQNLSNSLADPWTDGHLLGTDELGRDTLSRLVDATGVGLQATATAVGTAVLLGVPAGLVAGYLKGAADFVVMRVTETLETFPALILAMAMVSLVGPGLRNAMVAIGVVFAPGFLRVTRSAVLAVREETFVEASRSIGTPTFRILRTRILPNIVHSLLVHTSLAAGFALLAEASLSFIGLGVQLPNASWGSMLGRGYHHFSTQPWLIVFPGTAIALTVLAFNQLGDGLNASFGREIRRAR